MNKTALYKYSVIFLLLLNLGLVAFFMISRPKAPPGKQRPGQGSHEILNLDKDQEKLFSSLVQGHQELMRSYNEEQRKLLEPYFKTLIDKANHFEMDSIIDQIVTLERSKITSVYNHFQDIKRLLSPEQERDFEQFIKRSMDVILSGQKRRPPRPKDF